MDRDGFDAEQMSPMFREASARGAPPGDPNKERLLYMLTCQELS